MFVYLILLSMLVARRPLYDCIPDSVVYAGC